MTEPKPIAPVPVPYADLVDKIKAAHASVVVGMKDTVTKSMALGYILILAKDRMPHGDFLPWVEQHCGVAKRTAQQCMKWARNRSKIEGAMRNAQENAHFTQADANKLLATAQ